MALSCQYVCLRTVEPDTQHTRTDATRHPSAAKVAHPEVCEGCVKGVCVCVCASCLLSTVLKWQIRSELTSQMIRFE